MKNAKITHLNQKLLACDADDEVAVTEEMVITGVFFFLLLLFLTNVLTQLTVYACGMITMKLR